jgi:large conductance mechanosensitive channel
MNPLKTIESFPPAKKAVSFLDDFKKFAFKGNVIDLAIGIIIGAAFTAVVNALVKSIIMPLISVVLPTDQGYLQWKWVINGKDVPYGVFLGEILNFVLVALVLFVFFVKFVGWIMQTKAEEPPPTKDQVLLTEIRDLLKANCPPATPAPAPSPPPP